MKKIITLFIALTLITSFVMADDEINYDAFDSTLLDREFNNPNWPAGYDQADIGEMLDNPNLKDDQLLKIAQLSTINTDNLNKIVSHKGFTENVWNEISKKSTFKVKDITAANLNTLTSKTFFDRNKLTTVQLEGASFETFKAVLQSKGGKLGEGAADAAIYSEYAKNFLGNPNFKLSGDADTIIILSDDKSMIVSHGEKTLAVGQGQLVTSVVTGTKNGQKYIDIEPKNRRLAGTASYTVTETGIEYINNLGETIIIEDNAGRITEVSPAADGTARYVINFIDVVTNAKKVTLTENRDYDLTFADNVVVPMRGGALFDKISYDAQTGLVNFDDFSVQADAVRLQPGDDPLKRINGGNYRSDDRVIGHQIILGDLAENAKGRDRNIKITYKGNTMIDVIGKGTRITIYDTENPYERINIGVSGQGRGKVYLAPDHELDLATFTRLELNKAGNTVILTSQRQIRGTDSVTQQVFDNRYVNVLGDYATSLPDEPVIIRLHAEGGTASITSPGAAEIPGSTITGGYNVDVNSKNRVYYDIDGTLLRVAQAGTGIDKVKIGGAELIPRKGPFEYVFATSQIEQLASATYGKGDPKKEKEIEIEVIRQFTLLLLNEDKLNILKKQANNDIAFDAAVKTKKQGYAYNLDDYIFTELDPDILSQIDLSVLAIDSAKLSLESLEYDLAQVRTIKKITRTDTISTHYPNQEEWKDLFLYLDGKYVNVQEVVNKGYDTKLPVGTTIVARADLNTQTLSGKFVDDMFLNGKRVPDATKLPISEVSYALFNNGQLDQIVMKEGTQLGYPGANGETAVAHTSDGVVVAVGAVENAPVVASSETPTEKKVDSSPGAVTATGSNEAGNVETVVVASSKDDLVRDTDVEMGGITPEYASTYSSTYREAQRDAYAVATEGAPGNVVQLTDTWGLNAGQLANFGYTSVEESPGVLRTATGKILVPVGNNNYLEMNQEDFNALNLPSHENVVAAVVQRTSSGSTISRALTGSQAAPNVASNSPKEKTTDDADYLMLKFARKKLKSTKEIGEGLLEAVKTPDIKPTGYQVAVIEDVLRGLEAKEKEESTVETPAGVTTVKPEQPSAEIVKLETNIDDLNDQKDVLYAELKEQQVITHTVEQENLKPANQLIVDNIYTELLLGKGRQSKNTVIAEGIGINFEVKDPSGAVYEPVGEVYTVTYDRKEGPVTYTFQLYKGDRTDPEFGDVKKDNYVLVPTIDGNHVQPVDVGTETSTIYNTVITQLRIQDEARKKYTSALAKENKIGLEQNKVANQIKATTAVRDAAYVNEQRLTKRKQFNEELRISKEKTRITTDLITGVIKNPGTADIVSKIANLEIAGPKIDGQETDNIPVDDAAKIAAAVALIPVVAKTNVGDAYSEYNKLNAYVSVSVLNKLSTTSQGIDTLPNQEFTNLANSMNNIYKNRPGLVERNMIAQFVAQSRDVGNIKQFIPATEEELRTGNYKEYERAIKKEAENLLAGR